MGTSSSYGGPSDKPGLLPSWALPDGGDAQPPSAEPESPPDADAGDEQPTTPQPQSTTPNLWSNAKSSMSRYAKGGERSQLSRAGSNYTAAKGGSRKAASSAISGKIISSGLGSLLSSFSQRGISTGLESVGLGSMVGDSADKILSAISNQIAPSGASLEEEAARMAINDVLAWLYENFITEDGDISALEHMSVEDIDITILRSVGAYIYQKWLQELGKCIEKGAISETAAIKLERDVKEYVLERLNSKMQNKDVANTDWAGKEGMKIINDLYKEAYSILEAGE